MVAGGILHVDIHADNVFKSKTDMQLATHALVSANHDPNSDYVIVSNDNDFLPLIRSLQNLGRRVVIVTFARRASAITAAADGWIGLNTPKKPRTEPLKSGTTLICASSQFEDSCAKLADCLVLCSGNIYSKLRSRMRLEPELLAERENLPSSLLTCKGFKKSLAQGLKGEDWTAQEKAAVAQLLLDHDSEDLFAQIGYLLAKVTSSQFTLL